jgi:hypothetical protein
MSRYSTPRSLSGHVSLSTKTSKGNCASRWRHRNAIAALQDGVPIFVNLIGSHGRLQTTELVKTPHPGVSGAGRSCAKLTPFTASRLPLRKTLPCLWRQRRARFVT